MSKFDDYMTSTPTPTAPQQQGIGSKISDFVTGAATSLAKPFVNLGAMAGNAIAGTANSWGLLPKDVSSNLTNMQNAGGFQDPTFGKINTPTADVTQPITSSKNVGAFKSAAGTGLQIGADFAGGGEGEGLIGGGVKQAFIQGAKGGVLIGGSQGLGQSLENNQGLGDTLKNTATGAVTGALTGGTLGAVTEGLGNIWEKAYGASAADISSRTADATPAYSKDLIGQNVKTPEGNIVPRVNEGEGLTGERTVNTSASEAQSGQELQNLKDYPDKGTTLEKSQAVGRGINTEAENMRGSLQAEDKANPLDTNAEKLKVSQLVRENLPEDIQSKVGVNTPEENAMLKGMNDKLGIDQPPGGKFDLRAPGDVPNLPKTAAGRYYADVLEKLNEYDGTREGKLNLRQAIDQSYEQARGKLAWGSDSQNALDEVNRSIRDSLNKDLAESAQNTDTQASLKKQTNLYRAKDVLETKAKTEAPSEIGRFFQNHPILHRLVTRESLKVLGSATGGAILASYITKLLKGSQ